MENKLTILDSTRAEIDMQISTAKQYPRHLSQCLDTIRQYAMMDQATAEECFYALKRGEGDKEKIIEGLSVRMAEIFVSAWGNIRAGARIISNDGKTIVAQGICHDLETNVAVTVEVARRITTNKGYTYSEDMQVVTGNAASAIAFRNAVFKVIPKAITKKVINDIKQLALKSAESNITTSVANVINWYNTRGVKTEEILQYVGVSDISQINSELYLLLTSTANAIYEGTTTIEETFRQKKQQNVDEKKEILRNNKSKIEMK